jgi:hypothetical protein
MGRSFSRHAVETQAWSQREVANEPLNRFEGFNIFFAENITPKGKLLRNRN